MDNLMVVLTFSVSTAGIHFLGILGERNLNCQFKAKFGTETNLNMQNSMGMFIFSVSIRNTVFGQNVSAEMQYLNLFAYTQFIGVAAFFCLRPGMPFSRKFGLKNQNCQFKLKSCTSTNSNMQKSMMRFTFSILDRKYSLWANLVQIIKVISLY